MKQNAGFVASVEVDARLPYSTPILVALGDVRMLTLGGSPGFGDSAPQPQNPPEA
ncbi:MAG: lasso RiPP family leader peptide-containing protein [Xanthomonadales bacterium]|nr:lasso RiPP family leader peptide-containing protein [Xanthomonadales bacterium]